MSINRCAPQILVSARLSGLLLGTLLAGAPLAAQAARAYVSDEDDNAISVIDTDRGVVIATVDVGKRPRGLKLSRDGAHLYVAVSGLPKCPPTVSDKECAQRKHDLAADGIADVDTAKLKLVKLLKAGTDPEQFDISTDGRRLFISNEDAATASVLNVASGALEATIPVGREPEGARASPDGHLVVITSEEDNSISVIDARSLHVVRTIAVGKRPRDVAFTPDSAIAYVTGEADASVYRATLAKDEPATRLLQLRPQARPMGVVLDSAKERLYVSTGRGATVAVISLQGPKLITEVPVGARPWGLALSRDGHRLYTANGSSNDVSVVDTGTLQVIRKIPVGRSPWGIVLSR
ncbi:MAG TPA: beta-propeller fold lactonase family protein [Steroidobacteraceae bacterium]